MCWGPMETENYIVLPWMVKWIIHTVVKCLNPVQFFLNIQRSVSRVRYVKQKKEFEIIMRYYIMNPVTKPIEIVDIAIDT